MADREASFAELIEVLRQAQDAVHRELELRHTQEFDREALLRLLMYVHSFADQALSLFRLMANSGFTRDFTILENNCTQSIATCVAVPADWSAAYSGMR